ncbi:hypothetical protein LT40_17920 [Pseudomonas rhizosphaerae]|uniref:Dermonecrotic toxin N-terminal domain-containing protein n=1 Tax=Pseudomonas rhizosphaerae TaxID=216142 RepID=A0A089YRU1_9PSED|nr:membrane-targeted effector domain-containing toxin [Pseudomonas rhizosphaerae]AIS19173.1 hypothetical protein LT40_17920 [Pseudomonas rhizosphaerae]
MTLHTAPDLASVLELQAGDGPQRTALLNTAGLLLAQAQEAHAALNGLLAQKPEEVGQYWQDLAPGALMSRRDHARQLRRQVWSDRSALLTLFAQLSPRVASWLDDSSPGTMAVRCCTLVLHGSDGTRLGLPGALAFDDPASPGCLLVIPGVEHELFEFDSRELAAQALIEYLLSEAGSAYATWLNAPALLAASSTIGVMLLFEPAAGDPWSVSIDASIAALGVNSFAERTQWFCRALPDAYVEAVASVSSRDARRQQPLLHFHSFGASLSDALCHEKGVACEAAIARFFGEPMDSDEFKRYRQAHAELQAAQARGDALLNELINAPQVLPADHWSAKDDTGLDRTQRLVSSLAKGLLQEAQLQVYEQTLSIEALALVTEVVTHPSARERGDSSITVLEVAMGDAEFAWTLPGALVLRNEDAGQSATPALLFYLMGCEGGLKSFESIDALRTCLQATLADTAYDLLWSRLDSMGLAALQRFRSIGNVPVLMREVEGDAISQCVQDCIDRAASARHDEPSRARLAQARQLRLPGSEIRDLAVGRIAEQRRVQATLAALPSWLTKAPDAVHKVYGLRLHAYNQAATDLERYLGGEPANLFSFAHGLLAQRLKADLGQDLDPEQVIVQMPDEVEHKAVPNVPSLIKRPSRATHRLHLVELALLNVDRQVSARLDFAQLFDGRTGLALNVAGLNAGYLRALVIELDIARQYRDKVVATFGLLDDAQPLGGLRSQILLAPYRHQLLLHALSAQQQGQLDAAGVALLERAVAARTPTALAQQNLAVCTVTLSLGGQERDLYTSLVLIHDPVAQQVVLYLPDVPQGGEFIQAATPAAASDQLLRRLLKPAVLTWLAGQGGLHEASPERVAYLDTALLRNYMGFIAYRAVSHRVYPVAACLLETRKHLLLAEAAAASRSRDDVRQAFKQQLLGGARQLLISGLSYQPGIGTAIQLHDGWNDAQAAANAFSQGHTALGLRRMASAELNFGFALLSFIPGAAGLRAARDSVRKRQRLATAMPPIDVGHKRHVLNGFKGHEVDISLVAAKAQNGRNLGTWKKDGKLYIWQDGKAYEVFRRPGELTLRLRKTARSGYEQPVRRAANGRFVGHADLPGKGGGKPAAAAAPTTPAEAKTSRYEIAEADRALLKPVMDAAHRNRRLLDPHMVSFSEMTTPTPGHLAKQRFFKLRDLLLADADQYLKELTLPARVELPGLAPNMSQRAFIEAVYAKAQGMVVGESHGMISGKRVIIDNLQTLKEQGVKTLYFEHLLSDMDGVDLATLNKQRKLPAGLKKELQTQDTGNGVPVGQPYTFLNVVEQASKMGIDVVAIDCAASYRISNMFYTGIAHRQRMFSYYASKVIQEHQAANGAHKWVALVGNSHANTFKRVPGLAEINRAIGLRVADVPKGQAAIQLDVGEGLQSGLGGPLHWTQADFYLTVEAPHVTVAGSTSLTARSAQPSPARLSAPGTFYIDSSAQGLAVVHLSRDGQTYRTPISKDAGGGYSVSRPSWAAVHDKPFADMDALLGGLSAQGMTHVP